MSPSHRSDEKAGQLRRGGNRRDCGFRRWRLPLCAVACLLLFEGPGCSGGGGGEFDRSDLQGAEQSRELLIRTEGDLPLAALEMELPFSRSNALFTGITCRTDGTHLEVLDRGGVKVYLLSDREHGFQGQDLRLTVFYSNLGASTPLGVPFDAGDVSVVKALDTGFHDLSEQVQIAWEGR